MDSRFAMDRMDIPQFWTVRGAQNAHDLTPGTVLAESDIHSSKDRGWVTMGYVSFDTPFGQGTYMGFPKHQLRPATAAEVLVALITPHPHGLGFRPHNLEGSDISFQLIMSSAIGNWTTDGPSAETHGSILPFSTQQLVDARRESNRKFAELMENWDLITTKQIVLIMQKFRPSLVE